MRYNYFCNLSCVQPSECLPGRVCLKMQVLSPYLNSPLSMTAGFSLRTLHSCVHAYCNYACLCVSLSCRSVWETPHLNSSITVCGDPWEQTGLWTCLAVSGMLKKVANQHCLRTGGAAGFNYGSVLCWETANFHSHIASLVTFSHGGSLLCTFVPHAPFTFIY